MSAEYNNIMSIFGAVYFDMEMKKTITESECGFGKAVISQKGIETGSCGKYPALVAIGASTGGPKALMDIIPVIPADIHAIFFIVQHMPPGFTKSLADRLNDLSMVTVKEAEDNETAKSGCVYIAPGDYHMTVIRGKDKEIRIRLTKDPPVFGHRPSINMLLDSISRIETGNLIAVILTGMGRDGTDGLINLKKSKPVYVIAQDKDSSVIYGMPKSAVESGVVDVVLPLGDIPKEIIKRVGV